LCDAYGASENLPSTEDIDNANEAQLRTIAKELLAVAQEARMNALHFKLQNSLASFASNKAIERAEVEQKLAKREVEILQSDEYRNRSRPADPLTPRPSQSVSTDEYLAALQRSQELEGANTLLDRRLRNAKRAIDDATTRSVELGEQNEMLKRRIEDNRRHFSQIYNYGCLSPGMQSEMQTICRGEAPDGLAALLFADKFTNRLHEPHNSYGAPSSVPMTPQQARSARQGGHYMTPAQGSQEQQQYDSDSTVSLSAAESEEEGMTTRHSHMRSTAPKTSTLLQTKLFGQVKKPGVERGQSTKRKATSSQTGSAKRSRTNGGVGLGIET
jgi:hypothetical protein